MLAFSLTLALCMFIPALGAFLAGADIREMGWKPNIRQNIRLILLAWLLPTVFQIIGAPVLGLFAFCVFTASTGIISYYLYQESETIWLPALYHGMINSTFNPCMLGEHGHSEGIAAR